MSVKTLEETIQSLEVVKEELIAAPIGVVFEAILEQMGPSNETPEGTPLPMKLEAWPGGRWLRDLGENTGHYWGTVQSIKPPVLLEIHGPLFMSGPAISNVMYRLEEEGGETRLKFSHRAIGFIPTQLMDGVNVNRGWSSLLTRVRTASEKKGGAK